MSHAPLVLPRVLVVIPALNEEMNIPLVLADLRAHVPEATLAVVDDGSSDGTAAVAAGLGARVFSLPYNLGIGGAVQTGLQHAAEAGYDIAIQFDADGQHLAREIPVLLAPILSGDADMVIGSRFAGQVSHRSSLLRRAGIRTFSHLTWLLTRQRVQDTTSGFRAYGRDALRYLARHYPTHYPEPEAIIWACRRHLRLTEVPVTMRDRQHGTSSITAWKSLYYILRVGLGMITTACRVAPDPQGT